MSELKSCHSCGEDAALINTKSPAVAGGEAEWKPQSSDLFRAGARAVFDAILFRVANNYHPKCQEQCDRENAVITDWMINALEQVSPADCNEWRSIDAAYQAGFNDGKIAGNIK